MLCEVFKPSCDFEASPQGTQGIENIGRLFQKYLVNNFQRNFPSAAK
jgi:hypothetical protein